MKHSLTTKLDVTVRPATPADVGVVFELIQALAEYEKLSHAVVGSAEALKEHLFGSKPYVEAIVAEYGGQAVGFALFFHNYSTFLTKPGIYLEDLCVLPEFRRKGIGRVLLNYLAQLAVSRGCGRLEWSVLDWNEPAIAFYRGLGASILENTRICRLTGGELTHLANGASSTILRGVQPADLPVLCRLIQQKAEFDGKSDTLALDAEALKEHLFGSQAYAEVILAEQAEQAVGFAVFFYNYSTFLTKPGLYIDDLFIDSEYRRQGIGKALLTYLANLAVERDCGRVEWLVAVWNESAITFYEKIGASVLPDWRICRVAGYSLTRLATELSTSAIG
jgi:GNAT superfamily N-acetyltransferase